MFVASSSEDPDELYEKAMILATKVYEVVCLADGSYVASIIHENKYISVKTTLLQTDKVMTGVASQSDSPAIHNIACVTSGS